MDDDDDDDCNLGGLADSPSDYPNIIDYEEYHYEEALDYLFDNGYLVLDCE